MAVVSYCIVPEEKWLSRRSIERVHEVTEAQHYHETIDAKVASQEKEKVAAEAQPEVMQEKSE